MPQSQLPVELLTLIFHFASEFPGLFDVQPTSPIDGSGWNFTRRPVQRNRSGKYATRSLLLKTLSLVCRQFKRLSEYFSFQHIEIIDDYPLEFNAIVALEALSITLESSNLHYGGGYGSWTKRIHLDFDMRERESDITQLLIRILRCCPNLITFVSLGSVDDPINGSAHFMTQLFKLCPNVMRVERSETMVWSVDCLRGQLMHATHLETFSPGASAQAEHQQYLPDFHETNVPPHRLLLPSLRSLEIEDDSFFTDIARHWDMPSLQHVTLRLSSGDPPITSQSSLSHFFEAHGALLRRLELLEDEECDAAIDLQPILHNCINLKELLAPLGVALSVPHLSKDRIPVQRLGIVGLERPWPFSGECCEQQRIRCVLLLSAMPDLKLIRAMDGTVAPQQLRELVQWANKTVRVENLRGSELVVRDGLVSLR